MAPGAPRRRQKRACFEIAETIDRRPAPHNACDPLCEVIIL
jgi:hypothetical protein